MLGMKKETFTVTGMTCGHCEARVNKAVADLDGVARVDASAANDSVEVTLRRGAALDRDTIAKTIQEAGYLVADAP